MNFKKINIDVNIRNIKPKKLTYEIKNKII